jgi:hypothetical protein
MAAQPAFNATLTRIGFNNDAIAAINLNQIMTSESLIGMTKDDVEQLMKVIYSSQGQPVIVMPFMA